MIFLLQNNQMKKRAELNVSQLASTLEEISPNFAYRMLFLQMGLHKDGDGNQHHKSHSTTSLITQLTQLYMRAVEVLEDRYSQGFQYFNWKIQQLLKKRPVIEELLKENKCSVEDHRNTMNTIRQIQIDQRRQEYELRMSLQNPVGDRKKVKQIIKNAELRLNIIESKIQTGIIEQENALASRIKLRRLRSQSSTKDINEIDSPVRCNQEFETPKLLSKYRDDSKGSGLSKKTSKRHLFSSFTQLQ